ncbi:hypothetical protein [Caldisalinibacter kiritimatiensis]|uniref:Uncharacterized protein n=1 Tax=Caldisalinibacter kiritimatiensis TaxID=1304284 RepID=R1AU94_9FIRM|nr:hypothetical protein [Caldisalinibacter kiritimatiensis]EOD00237.1 hypothetical protein L21TH_1711 [Caldisalinibacter kiritimatiensis]
MNKKKKSYLTIALVISLLPMFLSWFGSARGVQEIKGTIVLFNPITILCIVVFLIGVWYRFKKKQVNTMIPLIALSGIILIEVYEFLTWHYMTITGRISLEISFAMTYPEFYFGLFSSILMLILYLYLTKITDSKNKNKYKHYLL